MALQTFTAGQVLTAAQVNALQANDYNQTVSNKTDSYTLVAADKGTRVVMNKATATTITVNTSLFSAGDTLFIQNIGAGICTITAGTATVSTSGSLALAQNAGGTLYFTSTGVSIFLASATASSSGKILQVVSTAKTDTFSMSSATFADITGLTATITPSSATSKILVMFSSSASLNFNNTSAGFRLTRGGTAIGVGDAAGSRERAYGPRIKSMSLFDAANVNGSFLDSPATTSATTYALQIRSEIGGVSVYVNRAETDADNSATFRGISTITVMEVTP